MIHDKFKTIIVFCPICREDSAFAMADEIPPGADPKKKLAGRVPCAKCQGKINQMKKKGFVFMVISDGFAEASKAATLKRMKPTEWQYFRRAHAIKPGAVKELAKYFDFDETQGWAYISESDASHIGLTMKNHIGRFI